jgi:hypothetical protein
MANTTVNFKDALVFIYDKKNNLITKTTITGFNRDEMCIEVSEGLDKIEPRTRLQLLIIQTGGASEFNGILKSARKDKYEILVYEERQRDVRVSVRRTLSVSAVISDMVTEPESEALGSPLPVVIENMSTSGILIKSQEMRFEIGTLLQIDLNVDKKIGILYGEVVREQKHADGAYRYGCKLYFF